MEVDTEPRSESEIEHEVPQQEEEVSQEMPHEQENEFEEESPDQDFSDEKQVPLSALQRERKKRQEERDLRTRNEVELQYLKEQLSAKTSEPDFEEDYDDPVTKSEADKREKKTRFELKQEIKEELWKESNPAKVTFVDDNLEEFLRQRPHYAQAIQSSGNRYHEAYELLSRFTPQKEERRPRAATKRAPSSPHAVPKEAPASTEKDLFAMSHSEFEAWREEQRRR